MLCQGNICRSPTAACMLAAALPDRQISSAGLGALVGHDMDPVARAVAAQHGLTCPAHRAQQLNAEQAVTADLLLVMDQPQRQQVMQHFPAASGKVFLLDHWSGGEDIADPYQQPKAVYQQTYQMLARGVSGWLTRI